MNAPTGGGGVGQMQSIAFRGEGGVGPKSLNAFLAPLKKVRGVKQTHNSNLLKLYFFS